jgi:DNA-binding cell septation regulator SpoVG
MAKRKKSSGLGGLGQQSFSNDRKVVLPLEDTKKSEGTKPTWKTEGVEYKRMSFFVSMELRKKIKTAIAQDEEFQYQDALVNAALEEFFKHRG